MASDELRSFSVAVSIRVLVGIAQELRWLDGKGSIYA